jgi:hypothetical protein
MENPNIRRGTIPYKNNQEPNLSTSLKENSHMNRIPTLTTKIIGSNNQSFFLNIS